MRNDPARQVARESLALRLVWTLLFAIGWQLAELILLAVVVVQFIHRLAKGALHGGLLAFGDSLGQFLGQTARYLTFAREEKPWPFAPWPVAEVRAEDEIA